MTCAYWKTSADGAFETSSNWTPTGVPGVGDLAFITATGPDPYKVIVSADEKVSGISLGTKATLDITNSATFTADEGTATGTNFGFIDVEAGSTFIFGGLLNNQNTIQLIGAGAVGADVFLRGDTTLRWRQFLSFGYHPQQRSGVRYADER